MPKGKTLTTENLNDRQTRKLNKNIRRGFKISPRSGNVSALQLSNADLQDAFEKAQRPRDKEIARQVMVKRGLLTGH